MRLTEPDAGLNEQPHSSVSLSSLLLDLAVNFSAERIRIRDIIDSMGERSFGFILFVFALPNSLPFMGIPGVSTVMGIPLLLVAGQMALRHKQVYLPSWVTERSLATQDFHKLMIKVLPWMKRLERLLKPRFGFLVRGSMDAWLGAFCVLLALLLILPIPFGNFFPALGILFIALGLLERDGVFVIAGLVMGVVSWFFLSGLIWIFVQTSLSIIDRLF